MDSATQTIDRANPTASIIIPAHNEERMIGNCLGPLLAGAAIDEFDIVVVCNGCSDRTEHAARQFGPQVRVLSIGNASKTDALNLGDRVAKTYPRIYLDSDLQVTTRAVRALLNALQGTKIAAVGFMDFDLDNRSWLIRSFYRVWMQNPYLTQGKFGGIYALTEEGFTRRGKYPSIIADDAFAKNCFGPQECAAVPECRFTVSPPATVPDVIRVRTRAYLGNYQLRNFAHTRSVLQDSGNGSWLRHAAQTPRLWPGMIIFLALTLAAKTNALLRYRSAEFTWLRDESSRQRAVPRTQV